MNSALFANLLVIAAAPVVEAADLRIEPTETGRAVADSPCPFCEDGETCSQCDGSPRPEPAPYMPDIPGVNVPFPICEEETDDFDDDGIEPPTCYCPGFGWMVI